MRTLLAIALFLAGLLVLAFVISLARWAGLEGDPLSILGELLANATTITQQITLLVGLAAIAGLTFGVIALLGPPSADQRLILTILSLAPSGGGLLGALLGLLVVYEVATASHTTNLKVVAPGIAESLTPLGLGLLAGIFAAAPNAILARRGVSE